jgi:hypothetical protein
MVEIFERPKLSLKFFSSKGGNDKTAVVFNNSTQQLIATLKGHTKKVTKAIFHPEEVR